MKLFLALLLITNITFAQGLRRGAGADLPAGMVIAHAGQACPTGFLKADGASLTRTAYQSLFDSIGTAHGSASITTFNLPDYRGLFLRMIDETKGNDIDKASRTAMNAGGAVGNLVGSIQGDSMQGHRHGYKAHLTINYAGGGTSTAITDIGTIFTNGDQLIREPITDGVNGTPRTSTESRSKNAYVIYCVKF